MHDVMRRKEQDQGSESSHAKDNEEASQTSSLLAATTEARDDHELSDVLLARLSEIRASVPSFVDMKLLQSTDVRCDQNRLQLSGHSPISQILTNAEKARIKTPGGMPVTVFDHRGQQYEMTCKMWRNKHYRFMGPGWKNFLQAHHLTIAKDAHLTRSVTVKLLGFRSRALLPEFKDDGEEEGELGHPDGALGLVMLLVDEGEQEEVAPAEEEDEEEEVEEVVAAEEEEVAAPRTFLEVVGTVALSLLWTLD